MRRWFTGVLLNIFSILLWFILLALRWDYVVNVMYPGDALGEPIWVHDPSGFWSISLVCGLLALGGVALIIRTRLLKN